MVISSLTQSTRAGQIQFQRSECKQTKIRYPHPTFDNQQDLPDFLLREAHRVYPVTPARAGVQGQRSPTLVKAEMKMSTDAGRRAWRLKPISEFSVRDFQHAVGYRL